MKEPITSISKSRRQKSRFIDLRLVWGDSGALGEYLEYPEFFLRKEGQGNQV